MVDRERKRGTPRDRSSSRVSRRSRRERSSSRRDRESPRDKDRRRRDRSRSSSRDRDDRRRARSGRRGRDRSRSPRRSRKRRDRSRSGSRGDRRQRRRRRRDRSQSTSRSPSRGDRRRGGRGSGRRRRDRDRSYSPRNRSRSPHSRRRGGRRGGYSQDSSSEHEDRRRGRRHRYRNRRKDRQFRLGDKVKIRAKNRHGYEEKGEIDKILPGMYGEKTYQVYIESRDCWEKWVPARDLKHWSFSKEEARATGEIYELRKQIKAGDRIANRRPNSFDERDEPRGGDRGGRRSRYRSERGGARWEGSNAASPQRGGTRGGRYPQAASEPDPQPYHNAAETGRATSVPLQNYTWPQFIADLTHAVYTRDKDGHPDDNQVVGPFEEEPDRREKGDQTMHVSAPEEIRSAYGGDRRDDPRGYDDGDELNTREAVASIKDGDIADEYNVGTRDDRRRGAEAYNGGGPLIYIHCHPSVRDNDVRRDDRRDDYAYRKT